MKKLFSLIFLLLPAILNAQNMAVFTLNQYGEYQSSEGDDFIIIPFDGKTAHEIYQELASNVGSLYNEPSKVMSTVEDASIKIRAFSNDLIRVSVLGLKSSFGGYYQLEFLIKDGRVRVSAPLIEETLWSGSPTQRSFFKEIKKYFKDGKLKENKESDYTVVVTKMNTIINTILGTTKTKEEKNW